MLFVLFLVFVFFKQINRGLTVCYCSIGLYTVLLICLKFSLGVPPHILANNYFLPVVFICHTAALKCGVED